MQTIHIVIHSFCGQYKKPFWRHMFMTIKTRALAESGVEG